MINKSSRCLLSSEGSFDLRHVPFGRRGCFLCVLDDDMDRGLYVSLSRSPHMWMQRKNLVRLIPEHDDRPTAFRYMAEAGRLALLTPQGTAEICLDRLGRMHIRVEGISLCLRYAMLPEEYTVFMGDGCFEAAFNIIGRLRLTRQTGSLTAEETGRKDSREITLLLTPSPVSGRGELLIVEHQSDPSPAAAAPVDAFEACVADAEKDFEEFAKRFRGTGSAMRTLAAWTVWMHTLGPGGHLKHEVVYMTRTQWLRAFGWQQSFHSMAVSAGAREAWALISTMFDYQDAAGQLPDSIGDIGSAYMVTKPALQGMALSLWLRRYSLRDVPKREIAALYAGFSTFANWWLNCRDRNHTGIPQYYHGDESPGEFCTCFRDGVPLYAGDLIAFLILLTEGASVLAEALGRAEEVRAWQERSDRLMTVLTQEFWDGNGFLFRHAGTGKTVKSGAYMSLLPVILGRRLPEAIMDRVAARLMDEREYLTPTGLAIENLQESEDLTANPGPKGAMAFIGTLATLGLADAGRRAEAREIARRTCSAMEKNGFTFMSFADAERGERQNRPVDRWTSWSASCYLILTDILDQV